MPAHNIFLIGFSRNRIEAVNHGLGLPEPEPSHYGLAIAIVVVLVLCIAVAVSILLFKVQRRPLNDSSKLFLELCRAHGLNRNQRQVLIDLADARKLKDPCLVLLDAAHWILDPNTDHTLCQPKFRSRLVAVQRVLFDSDAGTAHAARS